MKLNQFEFPKVTGLDMTFPTFKTNNELLKEAKKRGFYNGYTPYNKLFSELFFNGGTVKFKKKIDKEFKSKAWAYCRSFMGSYEPKHQEKEAICAMIMSELLEPKLK